jgi:hypothetical protein
MISQIIFIFSLVLEVIFLLVFVSYILKYLRQYNEKVDPYTKVTLILLGVSFFIQILRLPIVICELIFESSSPDSRFHEWWIENRTFITKDILSVIVFIHGNV